MHRRLEWFVRQPQANAEAFVGGVPDLSRIERRSRHECAGETTGLAAVRTRVA
jgi:hypothetical protein